MISPEVLRRFPHFAGVPDDCLKSLAMISDERSFKAEETIFQESGEFVGSAKLYEKGGEAGHLLLLTKGQVDVVFNLASGRQVIVGTLVPGDLMAISALIPPYRLTATGIAKEDVELIQLEAGKLRELCEEVPELGYRLMMAIAKSAMNRLSEARVQLAALD